MIRGIRGAISVEKNTKDAILQATRYLLEKIVLVNNLIIEDIAGIMFSATQDLDQVYPAQAARELGWNTTAFFCVQEMLVPGSLPRCIRVLILWNTDASLQDVKHVYLGEARSLRPDFS